MRTPRTEEELLDREQALAVAGVVTTAERLVDDASEALGLEESFRKHPVIVSAVAALGGVAAGKALLGLGETAARLYLARPPSPFGWLGGPRWLRR